MKIKLLDTNYTTVEVSDEVGDYLNVVPNVDKDTLADYILIHEMTPEQLSDTEYMISIIDYLVEMWA